MTQDAQEREQLRRDGPVTEAEPDLAPPVQQPGAFDLAFLTGVPGVTDVFLVRHAQQQIDLAGPVGEMVDPPLSALGDRQADAVGRLLASDRLAAVYCSPLRRARTTAEQVARHHGLTPIVVHDLREVEIWRDVPQEKSIREILGPHYLTAVRERMIAEKVWDVYPYSEPSAVFRRRAINAIEAILAAHSSERIAIICHGGVINAYTGHLVASPYDMFFRPAHASVCRVLAGHGRRAVRSLNDVHHLAEGLETY